MIKFLRAEINRLERRILELEKDAKKLEWLCAEKSAIIKNLRRFNEF